MNNFLNWICSHFLLWFRYCLFSWTFIFTFADTLSICFQFSYFTSFIIAFFYIFRSFLWFFMLLIYLLMYSQRWFFKFFIWVVSIWRIQITWLRWICISFDFGRPINIILGTLRRKQQLSFFTILIFLLYLFYSLAWFFK